MLQVTATNFLLSYLRNMSWIGLLCDILLRQALPNVSIRYQAKSCTTLPAKTRTDVIHKPMFTRNYAKFCQDPESVSLHWIAQLFMVVALGLVFNHFTAPHELEADSSVPVMEQIRNFRSCAAWALTWGKYTQPTHETLPAFILYVEAYFLFNRAAQMNCYILSGVCVRLMLKMGLHRDPSKLLNISAFEGEMRRRYWYMAVQVELLVSFHMGLPSIMAGIESDTEFPKNYKDDDFDEDMKQMPQERSLMDHTHMTYPIIKTKLMTVFGKIARQAHALTPPMYAETMRLDSMLNGVWDSVPAIVKFRPLEESVGDAPSLIIQRIGLASLYSKARCVLHRRYLAEPILKREHDYSRIQCLDAAVTLLHFQSTMWTATRPGNSLSEVGWFVSSLAVHDYMLAATIIYIVVKCEQYSDSGKDMEWAKTDKTLPSRAALVDMLRRSYEIWTHVSSSVTELRKTSDTLRVMLTKLGSPVPSPDASTNSPPDLISELSRSRGASTATSWNTGPTSVDVASSTGLGQLLQHQQPPLSFGLSDTDPLLSSVYATGDGLFDASQMDTAWMAVADEMDWRQVDIFGTNQAEMNLSMADDGWAANASAWNIR
ncbi:hypothetical protein VHEMI01120 [[Torrubiella] hemipterigena]|uniref:Xylanolytic transcriptional activator regulatory domain-containing protein n=1 Tax=[Torrubiella] hemipterigena TaxID=1531966 RepID=A0A0A1T4C5_9HYPO|nr:hypothetical protein VHEMI01120 [[Torrubiella] hemipterigena]